MEGLALGKCDVCYGSHSSFLPAFTLTGKCETRAGLVVQYLPRAGHYQLPNRIPSHTTPPQAVDYSDFLVVSQSNVVSMLQWLNHVVEKVMKKNLYKRRNNVAVPSYKATVRAMHSLTTFHHISFYICRPSLTKLLNALPITDKSFQMPVRLKYMQLDCLRTKARMHLMAEFF